MPLRSELAIACKNAWELSNRVPVHSHTSMNMFQQCIQKYVLHYLYGLRSRQIIVHLIAGRGFHTGIATLLTSVSKAKSSKTKQSQKMRLAAAAKQIKVAIKSVDKVFDIQLERQEAMIGNITANLEYARSQIRACLRGWYTVYGLPPFKVLEIEYKPKRPKGTTIDSDTIDRLNILVDALIQYSRPKRISVLEHKTATVVAESNLISNIELDAQAHSYLLTVNDRMHLPQNCGSYTYNIAVKPKHKLNQSTNDYLELEDRMYQAIVAAPEKYLCMVEVEVDIRAMQQTHTNLRRIMHRIDNLQPDQVELAQGTCFMYGEPCDYSPLCKACVDAGDPKQVFECSKTSLYEIDRYDAKGKAREKGEKPGGRSKRRKSIKPPR